MKILFPLITLVFLASCTYQSAPVREEKMMKPEPMQQESIKQEPMKKEEVMMKDDMMKTMTGDMMKKDDKMMMDGSMTGDTMMKDEMKKETMMKDEAKMMKATGYMNYDEAKVKDALASGQKVALFFHAPWCPSCRALDTAINNNLSLIPEDTLIVKVDYDTSIDMKKKYGVTSQHTTVLIDKDMNLVSKKTGARSVGEILN